MKRIGAGFPGCGLGALQYVNVAFSVSKLANKTTRMIRVAFDILSLDFADISANKRAVSLESMVGEMIGVL